MSSDLGAEDQKDHLVFAQKWVVRWTSSRTSSTGTGDRRWPTRAAAQSWADELNARPINKYLRHTVEAVPA